MALNLDYVFRETGTNLVRNVGLTVASILTVAIAIVLVGASFVIRTGVANATLQFQGGIELIVFMDPEIRGPQREAIERSLDDNPEVERFTYVNKREAFEEFKVLFKDSPEMIESVEPAQLPPSFKVVPVNPNAASVSSLADQYEGDAGVKDVVSADDTIRTMQELFRFVSVMCVVVAGVAAVSAIVLIFNTIRVAMFARRREIEVMKLVGATNWFIRVPFMFEGLIQGLTGSVAAVGAIYLGNNLLGDQLEKKGIALLANFAVPSGELFGLAVALLIVGSVVSVVFSGIAASLYLDV
jgi:cell division transport system permease protein